MRCCYKTDSGGASAPKVVASPRFDFSCPVCAAHPKTNISEMWTILVRTSKQSKLARFSDLL